MINILNSFLWNNWLILDIMFLKGGVHLKQIALFMLIVLCVFPVIALAQQGLTYEVSNSFIVVFPENWSVSRNPRYSDMLLEAHSPTKGPTIGLFLSESKYKNLDEFVNDSLQNIAKSNIALKLEDNNNMLIDNREAAFLLYSGYNRKQEMQYHYIYHFFNGQNAYYIFIIGDYNNLGSDRKIINDVLSSIKIVK
jgi:hypothetical protein